MGREERGRKAWGRVSQVCAMRVFGSFWTHAWEDVVATPKHEPVSCRVLANRGPASEFSLAYGLCLPAVR